MAVMSGSRIFPLEILANYIHIPVLIAVFSVVFPLKTQLNIGTPWIWLISPIPAVQIITTLFRWVVYKEYTTTLASFPYAVTEILVGLQLEGIISSPLWTYILVPTMAAEMLFSFIVWCCACFANKRSHDNKTQTSFKWLCRDNETICDLMDLQAIISRFFGKILHFIPFYLVLFTSLKLDAFLNISWFQMIGTLAMAQIGLCIVFITIQNFAFSPDAQQSFRDGLPANREVGDRRNPDASTYALEIIIRSPLLTTSIGILAVSELGLALCLDGVLDWNRFWLFVPAYLSILLFMIYVMCNIMSFCIESFSSMGKYADMKY